MKTKRPLQAEPEWLEERFRVPAARDRLTPTPLSLRPLAQSSGSAAKAVPGRPRGGGARRSRGFTMPASDASLWLDQVEGG
jgi:hypothetical protein